MVWINFEIFVYLGLILFYLLIYWSPPLFIVSQFILISCKFSKSGIPKNAGLLPSATKKLHWHLIPLLIIVTFHTPICGVHELMYVCNIFLSVDLLRSVIFVFGYSALNILIGITLPSLLASVLYLHKSVVWLGFLAWQLLLAGHQQLKTFDLTMSNSSLHTSLSSVCSTFHDISVLLCDSTACH